MQTTVSYSLSRLVKRVLLLCTLSLSGSLEAAAAVLEVGDLAPNFNLPGSDGKNYSLNQFKDKKFVVIAFFPKAFTGG